MIAPDKRVHFFVWLLITIAALFFFFYITDCAYFWIIANVIALLLAIGKEIFDCYKMKPTGIKRLDAILKKFGFIGNPSGFSIMDILADLAGMTVGNILFFVLILRNSANV